jgi:hypothetical protein
MDHASHYESACLWLLVRSPAWDCLNGGAAIRREVAALLSYDSRSRLIREPRPGSHQGGAFAQNHRRTPFFPFVGNPTNGARVHVLDDSDCA